jgi:hypothetical protein
LPPQFFVLYAVHLEAVWTAADTRLSPYPI